jgi:hypothetical protein
VIESGRLMGKNGDASWKLSTGEGKREWRKTVMFNKGFKKTPAVMGELKLFAFEFVRSAINFFFSLLVAFSLLDMVCEADYRLSVDYDDVSTTQFDIVVCLFSLFVSFEVV